MRTRKIAVLGGGVAGLSASLALARDGHEVSLIERDPIDTCRWEDSFAKQRKGIPHYLQPHAFNGRGRAELIKHFPDVYSSLLDAGAREVDMRAKLPGIAEPGDEELQFFRVRRPLIEWGFHKAVLAEPRIKVIAGANVRGFSIEKEKISSVEVDGQSIDVEVAVDAMGRRSPMPKWLDERGLKAPEQESSDCGVIYYSRYYKLRPGCELPDGPWMLSPRGDLGYMAFSTFHGDNDTFSGLLAVPTGDSELKVFAQEGAFESAIAQIPMLRAWANPQIAEPITPVQSIAGLQNTINTYDESLPQGLFPMADALCHTDPTMALGLSFSLIHAAELARSLREQEDLGDAFTSYSAAISHDLRERYRFAAAMDNQRLAMWRGERVDFAHRTGAYELFSVVAGSVVAMVDAEVFRAYLRRMWLLDGLEVFDRDIALQERVEKVFNEMLASPRPPQGPPREEMLEICREQ
ncbi:MAG: FAD-dependent oxidoreductase [Actinomycetota bacterium]